MITLNCPIESNGDLEGFSFAFGEEALRQRVSQRLQCVLGEWLLDRGIGTDYFNRVLGIKPFDLRIQELERSALTVENVHTADITKVTYRKQTREAIFEMLINKKLIVITLVSTPGSSSFEVYRSYLQRSGVNFIVE